MARSPYLLLALCWLVGCNGSSNEDSGAQLASSSAVPIINYGVGHVYPHDTTSYTEGFVFYDHHFFESSGAPEGYPQTRSMIGIDDLGSGKVDKKIELDRNKYFGEGIVFFKGKLYQLTYKNHTGFVYDATTFRRVDSFGYLNKYIYANRFTQNYVVKIDPVSGKVLGKLDLTSLVGQEKTRNPRGDVLNGIAYDPGADKIYVTGKLWAGIYEIVFSH